MTDARQDLADRIMAIALGEAVPDLKQIAELLPAYRISRATGLGGMGFQQQVEQFIAAKQFDWASDRTSKEYRIQLDCFDDFTGKPAAEITTDDIRSYIAYLSDIRNYKNTSIQNIINTLRCFFAWLHKNEAVSHNPVNGVKSFKISPLDTKRPLTQEQLELLRAVCENSREKALLEFLYSSACSGIEAERIDLSDVDFKRRRVLVAGKRRALYFSVSAKVLLQKYIAERSGGDALFCRNQRPYGRLGKSTIREIIRNIGKRAGLERKINSVVLRQTLAVNLLRTGMDTAVIRRIMGYSGDGTSEIYMAPRDDYVIHEYDRYLVR